MGGERGTERGPRKGWKRGEKTGTHMWPDRCAFVHAQKGYTGIRERTAERGVKCSPKVPISCCRRRRNKCRGIVFFSSLHSFCLRHHDKISIYSPASVSARYTRYLRVLEDRNDFVVARGIKIFFHNMLHLFKRTIRFSFNQSRRFVKTRRVTRARDTHQKRFMKF